MINPDVISNLEEFENLDVRSLISGINNVLSIVPVKIDEVRIIVSDPSISLIYRAKFSVLDDHLDQGRTLSRVRRSHDNQSLTVTFLWNDTHVTGLVSVPQLLPVDVLISKMLNAKNYEVDLGRTFKNEIDIELYAGNAFIKDEITFDSKMLEESLRPAKSLSTGFVFFVQKHYQKMLELRDRMQNLVQEKLEVKINFRTSTSDNFCPSDIASDVYRLSEWIDEHIYADSFNYCTLLITSNSVDLVEKTLNYYSKASGELKYGAYFEHFGCSNSISEFRVESLDDEEFSEKFFNTWFEDDIESGLLTPKIDQDFSLDEIVSRVLERLIT